jgi:NAD(P)-dependent dehydrogenase (short-subunit alcohol dehydrogenase family)
MAREAGSSAHRVEGTNMRSVITGATGFIGRNLLAQLLEREETVYAIVRPESVERLRAIGRRLGADDEQLIPIEGDLRAARLGVSDTDLARIAGAEHFFHVAAVYDLTADAAATGEANVDGTRHALELARVARFGHFHQVSSIAVAGRYRGTFTEAMIDEGVGLDHPYFATKNESERLVRDTCAIPWRVYRPGIVVGRSDNGEMDKIDGPYYFFDWLKRIALLPRAIPIALPFGGLVNIVPVDYVAQAIDHIAHADGIDNRAFHIVDPSPLSVVEVLERFSKAANGPRFVTLPTPGPTRAVVEGVTRAPIAIALERMGLPGSIADYLSWSTRFDTTNTDAALAGSGISLPPLDTYASVLWDFWRRRLDSAARGSGELGRAVAGRTVMITGASSGIGRATALKVAAAGGIPLLVARGVEALEATKAEIVKAGGTAFVHRCDLSDNEDCQRLAKEVLAMHGGVDILVNNAGRSIRRSVGASTDRFHDFERTMQLNYFGAVALILALLPAMRARKRGHVVNVSSIGVQTYPPRFAAYVASKAALDAFSRCAASEVHGDGIRFTTVHMPLVRTPMIAPTEMYRNFPTLTPDEAADMLCRAIANQPKRVSTPVGMVAQFTAAVAPDVQDRVLNFAYRLFPDSAAARGEATGEEPTHAELFVPGAGRDQRRGSGDLSLPQKAMVRLLRGIHW